MKINTTHITNNTLIAQYLSANYEECIETESHFSKPFDPDDLMVRFWSTKPRWVELAFKLRGKIVKLFGLKPGDDGNTELLEQAIRNGESYQMIDVLGKTDSETLISMTDKHLTMFFSFIVEDTNEGTRKIKANTLVKFNNWTGRIYFTLIKPFHHLVVRSMLKLTLASYI